MPSFFRWALFQRSRLNPVSVFCPTVCPFVWKHHVPFGQGDCVLPILTSGDILWHLMSVSVDRRISTPPPIWQTRSRWTIMAGGLDAMIQPHYWAGWCYVCREGTLGMQLRITVNLTPPSPDQWDDNGPKHSTLLQTWPSFLCRKTLLSFSVSKSDLCVTANIYPSVVLWE